MADNQGRLWTAPNSSLGYQLICVGDEPTCMKWLGYAQGMLAGLLGRSKGSTSLNCTPNGSIFIEINTRPNSIKIIGSIEVGVYLASSFFQVPDDTLTGTTTPLWAGRYGYWNSFSPDANDINNSAYLQGGFNLVQQLVFSNMSGVPPHTDQTVYRSGDSGNSNIFNSTLDKAADIITGLPAKLYGSRGFTDAPFNNVWISPSGRAINASYKIFRDYPTYSNYLPVGDTKTSNFLNLSAISPANSHSIGTANQVPIGSGVYISNIFYALPSNLTSTSFTANTAMKGLGCLAAARTNSGDILTAAATENFITMGEAGASVSGAYTIIVGLSSTIAASIKENILLANGSPLSIATNSTLNVKSIGNIDTCNGLSNPQAGAVQWLEFSPDCNFLYIGMYYIDTTPVFGAGNQTRVTFLIRRCGVLLGSALSVSSPATIYTSNYIYSVPSVGLSTFVAPIGGLRCQQSPSIGGISYHTVGFVQYGSYARNGSGTIGTTDLQALSYVVKADPANPADISASANAPIFLINTYSLSSSSSQPYFYNPNAGMVFVDYIKKIFAYSVSNLTWKILPIASGYTYYRVALYVASSVSLMPVNTYNTQTSYGSTYGIPGAMVCNMLGNRCAMSPDQKILYMLELVDLATGLYGGDPNKQRFVLVKVNLETGAYTVTNSPNKFEFQYVVTSTT